jgi:Flp pilus assembly protein TadD
MASREDLYAEAEQLKDAGNLDAAVEKLLELTRLHPDYALPHSALAVILSKQGRHDDAVAHAKQVCELEPNDPFSFTALSVICQRGGRIMEAEDAMARSRMMGPGR